MDVGDAEKLCINDVSLLDLDILGVPTVLLLIVVVAVAIGSEGSEVVAEIYENEFLVLPLLLLVLLL